jgi:CRP/FNR family transcriptional regulator
MHVSLSLLPCARCSSHSTNICRPFEGQPEAEFRGSPVREHCAPGKHLFRAGDALGPVFKITEGIAALFGVLPDGRRQLMRFLLPGTICGYLSENGRYSFDVEAITNIQACSFARHTFDVSVAHDAVFGAALRTEMSAALEELGVHMTVLGQLDSIERVADFLLRMRKAFHACGIQTSPLRLPMKRKQMANYLGLRAETVSRAFSELRQRQLIVPDGDVVMIINLPGLAVSAGRSTLDAKALTGQVTTPAGLDLPP